MRLLRVSVRNLAGLADSETTLPRSPIAGLAGPNGAGKSTLLVACITPWMRNLPPSDRPRFESSVSVDIELSDRERSELASFGTESRRGAEEIPDPVTITITKPPRAGIRIDGSGLFADAIQNLEFLADVPSLDVLYVPAERRFAPHSGGQINLELLLPTRRAQHVRDARAQAFAESGRLDENEFEQWATAISVAASLEGGDTSTWDRLKGATDALLAPKVLLAVTAQDLSIGIGLPDGRRHPLARLSSGERQALIILGSILRAGAAGTVAIVDEPDLHLHPRLAAQLFDAIAAIDVHQLITASHSPFLLDTMPFDTIVEMRPGELPVLLSSEAERLDAYRRMGFRASEITQAELVFITEGSDGERLRHLDPRLERAVWRGVEGRSRVIELVNELAQLGIPVIGVVDRDIEEPGVPEAIRDQIVVWDAADFEGQLLQSDAVVQSWIDRGQIPGDKSLTDLRAAIDDIAKQRIESAVAEQTQRYLAAEVPNQFPSTRGESPLELLEQMWANLHSPRDHERIYQEALARARELIEGEPRVFRFVRGKYVVGAVAGRLTNFRSGDGLLDVTVRDESAAEALRPLLDALDRVLPRRTMPPAVTALADPVARPQDVEQQHRRARVAIAKVVDGPRIDLPNLVASTLSDLIAYCEANNVDLDGAPFAFYETETPDHVKMRLGVPVKAVPQLPDGLVEVQFPPRVVAMVRWDGSFAREGEGALDRLQAWLAAGDNEVDEPPWEEYLEMPPDPLSGRWKARLVQPIGGWAGPMVGD